MGQRISILAWPSGATGAQDAVAPAPQGGVGPALGDGRLQDRQGGRPRNAAGRCRNKGGPDCERSANPFGSTPPMTGREEAHGKACPGTGFPFASSATAVNCFVGPKPASLAGGGPTTADLNT